MPNPALPSPAVAPRPGMWLRSRRRACVVAVLAALVPAGAAHAAPAAGTSAPVRVQPSSSAACEQARTHLQQVRSDLFAQLSPAPRPQAAFDHDADVLRRARAYAQEMARQRTASAEAVRQAHRLPGDTTSSEQARRARVTELRRRLAEAPDAATRRAHMRGLAEGNATVGDRIRMAVDAARARQQAVRGRQERQAQDAAEWARGRAAQREDRTEVRQRQQRTGLQRLLAAGAAVRSYCAG